jgi:AraC-like DNA-binding protein
MLLFLSIIAVFLSLMLLVFNTSHNRSSYYLCGFFFLVSIYGLIQYFVLYSKSVFFVAIAFFNFTFLTYLIGPVFYWYFRGVLSDDARLKKRDLWHLLPSAVFFFTSIPYILSPWSVKVLVATRLIDDSSYLGAIKTSVLYEVLPHSVIFLSRPILILVYSCGAVLLFLRWAMQKRNSMVLYQQRYVIIWLLVLLSFMFIVTTSQLLGIIDSVAHRRLTAFFTGNLLQIFSGIGFAGMLISPFFFPSILYGLPRLPEPVSKAKHETREVRAQTGTEKKHGHQLNSDYLLAIGQKTDSCMKELQPYLQKDFNLSQLSSMIHIPVHHLSYYFREENKQSFNDYRNGWRVIHAKKLIEEGNATRMTLEAIGLQSGFSSRNTFFIAFKKAEGISPSTFIDRFNH